MSEGLSLRVIARVHTDFPDKFGLPRQSGLAQLGGRVVFEKAFRRPEAVRGLEGFSHIWLLWHFSRAGRADWSPTVRPPRLGGNQRVGVFATRSPFRPNPVGLSCVKLEGIDYDAPDAPALLVSGVDMLDGTPVFDIKPYLPFADARPEAKGGFAQKAAARALQVDFPPALMQKVPESKRAALLEALAGDPRPAYQNTPDRRYGFGYAGLEIKFTVSGDTLRVCETEPAPAHPPDDKKEDTP